MSETNTKHFWFGFSLLLGASFIAFISYGGILGGQWVANYFSNLLPPQFSLLEVGAMLGLTVSLMLATFIVIKMAVYFYSAFYLDNKTPTPKKDTLPSIDSVKPERQPHPQTTALFSTEAKIPPHKPSEVVTPSYRV